MTPPANIVPQRKKCAARTRESIMTAAQQRFAAESYEGVSLRDIARDAGVDVALVSRYFGNKEGLFKEVLRDGEDSKFSVDVSADALPGFLVAMLSHQHGEERREHMDRLLIMLRSASSPAAAKLIRESFQGDVLEPLADVIGGPDSHMKASLAMAVVIGASFLKTVLASEPACAQDRGAFGEKLLQLLEGLLSSR